MAHVRILRRVIKSLAICRVLELTRCQTGSSCLRMITSKDWFKALSTLQSSISRPEFDFRSSLIEISIHCSAAFCIVFILDVMPISSSTTSAFCASRDSTTDRWYLGQRLDLRRKRFPITFWKVENPDVNASGFSEKALTNPSLVFWRYTRAMKASREVATILKNHYNN